MIDANKLVTNPTAMAGREGPQIVLNWVLPVDSYDTFEVYRKLGRFPEFPGDGKLVFRGRNNRFSDLSVAPQNIYYYTIFTKDSIGEYHWDNTTRQKSLAYSTGRSIEYFYKKLIDSVTNFDSENPIILEPVEDPQTGQIINLNATTDAYSQLWRFVKLISLELDNVLALIDFIPKLWNIDTTDIDFFPHFAYMLGLEPNYTISALSRRAEVKNLVNVYKYKGTKQSYIRMARSTLGVGHDVLIQETSRNVFIVGDILPDLTDPLVLFHYQMPYDTGKYLGSSGWGVGWYGHDKFVAFVKKGNKILANSTMRKLQEKTTPQFVPANIEGHFVILKKYTAYPKKPIASYITTVI